MTEEISEPINEKPARLTERFLKPKKLSKEDPLYSQEIIPPEDRKRAMQEMNSLEIRIGYIAAAYAALLAFLATILFPSTHIVNTPPVKGVCPPPYVFHGTDRVHCFASASNNVLALAIFTLVCAIAIALSVRLRRRVPATFASFLSGVAFFGIAAFGVMIAAPFLIYGGWLFMRARRIQKYGTTDAKRVATLAGAERAARKSGSAADRPARSSAKSASKEAPKTSPRADTTKRYTPKTPPKKRPVAPVEEKKPSRWRTRLEGLDHEG